MIRNVSLMSIERFFLFILFNQICGRLRGRLKAFVTDTAVVVCIESLHRSEFAAFFAYNAQLIVDHLSPTNFGIARDSSSSASFCLLGLLLALLSVFIIALECGFFGLLVLVVNITAVRPASSPYRISQRRGPRNGPDHRPELIR